MSEPFLGELRLMSFDFPPRGWAECNGQLLPINTNQALFALLGTTYGGDGQTNFALPDLRGRVPVHTGSELMLGLRAGKEAHTVTAQELPAHIHMLRASAQQANQAAPGILAASENAYGAVGDATMLHSATISSIGGGQPHDNRQPSLVLNWCIATITGVFPSQT